MSKYASFLNGKRKLLSTKGNPKTDLSTGFGYLTATLSLAPGNTSGFEVCPFRTDGCSSSCLGTEAGRGRMSNVRKARQERTQFLFEERPEFMRLLRKELTAFERKCKRAGLLPSVRLNVFSDITWELTGIMSEFPSIQFYDYTAIAARFSSRWKLPANYHLTFSRKESNQDKVEEVLRNGGNVAVVFRDRLPETYLGYKVIDGLAHDLRFKDERNVVVGLLAKGGAKKDRSGFVVDLDPVQAIAV